MDFPRLPGSHRGTGHRSRAAQPVVRPPDDPARRPAEAPAALPAAALACGTRWDCCGAAPGASAGSGPAWRLLSSPQHALGACEVDGNLLGARHEWSRGGLTGGALPLGGGCRPSPPPPRSRPLLPGRWPTTSAPARTASCETCSGGGPTSLAGSRRPHLLAAGPVPGLSSGTGLARPGTPPRAGGSRAAVQRDRRSSREQLGTEADLDPLLQSLWAAALLAQRRRPARHPHGRGGPRATRGRTRAHRCGAARDHTGAPG